MLAGLGKSVRPVTFQHGYQQLWKMQLIRKILGLKPKIGDKIVSNDYFGIVTEGVVVKESDFFYTVNGTCTYYDSLLNKQVQVPLTVYKCRSENHWFQKTQQGTNNGQRST
jgi:hypothetical protein